VARAFLPDSRKTESGAREFVERSLRTAAPFLVLLFSPGLGYAVPQGKPPAPPAAQAEQEPPEEDESLKPKEYTLNPVQSAREIVAGNFYFKKGNYRAASRRFLEATRWDPGSPEAFLKLGEVQEKMKDFAAARESYKKFLDLMPDPKGAEAVRKKLEKLPAK
jgi:tetratricopeptide (TPR) repeat protein